ncbi:MAG: periplasmic heavy metal sensor, partial [Thermodesulfobacteriota bacterium]|nr:periplasmic heavy metal sensor [Thermodesulfobacteriota bacterium]
FLWLFAPAALMVTNAKAQEKIPPGKWWRIPKVAEEMNLSDEEKQRLDDVSLTFRRKAVDLRSRLEKERIELGVLFEKEQIDEAAVLAQFKKVESARSVLALERFNVLLEVRKLLGRDRYERLKAKFKQFRGKKPKNRPKK